MKKVLAMILSLVLCLSMLAACGGSGDSEAADGEEAGGEEVAESDLAYVQNKGTLIVGITEFEPMDYQDADGNWIGFDADMARAFAEYLGVEVEFQIIDWDNKVMELDGKTIDVVWNGMTLTDEVKSAMACSNPYFNNAQVAIVPADKAEQFQTAESLAALQFAVENGSAGQEVLDDLGYSYTPVQDQATALLEVSSGTADAAVIDYLMAAAMVGEGTSYANLTYTVELNSEEYGVGFRQGSDLAAKLNEFFAASYADGTMQQVAETYNIADKLIEQK
ncbi:MAG: transporter substrate-binding domain-containing protein [Oscillospiraceae bacterium]